MFSTTEAYLSLGRWVRSPAEAGVEPGRRLHRPADLLPLDPGSCDRDCLHVADYLWRWDTDWFWCSGAFGVQHPLVRRIWPARYRRSDFYHRLIGLDHRFDDLGQDRPAAPDRARMSGSCRTSRSRWSDTAEFLRWFAEQRRHVTGLAVPAAAARRTRGRATAARTANPGRCTRCRPAGATSTSASGAPCRSPRAAATATSTGWWSRRSRDRRAQIAVLRCLLRPADLRRDLRRGGVYRAEGHLRSRSSADRDV